MVIFLNVRHYNGAHQYENYSSIADTSLAFVDASRANKVAESWSIVASNISGKSSQASGFVSCVAFKDFSLTSKSWVQIAPMSLCFYHMIW